MAFTWTGEKQDNPDIYVQQIGAGSALRLTTEPSNDYNPVWSPDGRKIAFISTRDRERAIYVMNADGSRQRSITRGIHRIGPGFAWSPVQTR